MTDPPAGPDLGSPVERRRAKQAERMRRKRAAERQSAAGDKNAA